MKVLALVLVSLTLRGQSPITVDIGTQGDGCTGYIWQPGTPGYDPAIGTGPLATLRYGTAFDCTTPTLAPGMWQADLTLEDPTKTAAGQRTFMIGANGATTEPLDVFALAGGKNVPVVKTIQILSIGGSVKLSLRTVNGQNALLSAYTLKPIQPNVDWLIPSGSIDGSNATFSLPSAPNPPKSLLLIRNGLVMTDGLDFSLSGSTITFSPGAIPQRRDSLAAHYRQ